LFNAAELDQRRAACLLHIHARSEILFDMHLQVANQFGVQIAIKLFFVENTAEAEKPGSK
jgi:hypothetical protein